MRKNLCWIMLIFLMMATLNSGCGGSSSNSGVATDNGTPQNQSQDNTPTVPNTPPSPDNTPQTPGQDVTPNTPTSPDNPAVPNNPSEIYDIRVLTDTWTISNGILSLKRGNEIRNGTVSGTVTFSNVVVSGDNNSVKATMTRSYDWGWDNGQSNHEDEVYYPVFENRGNNVWYYSKYGTTKDDEEDTITLTMTSSRTANVVEDDRNPLDPNSDYYHCTYTLTKQ
ncbi:MAG: hypothetical protein IJP89_10785 [Synergistaceae bacterium]|nr:hypothetical protein [Synergistaceae bacterium]